MAVQQPVHYAISWRLILRILAAVLFLIAVIVALGDAQTKWDAALVPGGLLLLTVSFL